MDNSLLPSAPEGFKLNADGVFAITSSKDIDHLVELASNPMWLKCLAKTESNGKGSWHYIVRFKSMDGQEMEISVPFSDLHSDHNQLIKQLSDLGAVIIPNKSVQLRQYFALMAKDLSDSIALRAERVGWVGDSLFFALPNTIVGDTEGAVINGLSSVRGRRIISSKGSLEDWQKNIGANLCGNSLRIGAITAAFASPLLRFLDCEGGGLHFFGDTSTGKTSLLKLFASVWGSPDFDQGGFMTHWNATANGLEGRARMHHSVGMCLDELGSYKGGDIGSTVYSLADGIAKAAMTQERTLREDPGWKLLFVSSGELSIRRKVEEATGGYRVGMSVRILDIPLPDKDSGNVEKGRQETDDLNAACAKYHGVAGQAFIEGLSALVGTSEELEELLKAQFSTLCTSRYNEELPQEQNRAIKRFALIELAGHLAVKLNILPLTEQDITTAVDELFELWLSNPDLMPIEDLGLENLKSYLLENWGDFPEHHNADTHPRALKGFRKNGYVLVLSQFFGEACGGVSKKLAIKKLRELCAIKDHGNGNTDKRNTAEMIVGGVKHKGYLISLSILGTVPNDSSTPEEAIVGASVNAKPNPHVPVPQRRARATRPNNKDVEQPAARDLQGEEPSGSISAVIIQRGQEEYAASQMQPEECFVAHKDMMEEEVKIEPPHIQGEEAAKQPKRKRPKLKVKSRETKE